MNKKASLRKQIAAVVHDINGIKADYESVAEEDIPEDVKTERYRLFAKMAELRAALSDAGGTIA